MHRPQSSCRSPRHPTSVGATRRLQSPCRPLCHPTPVRVTPQPQLHCRPCHRHSQHIITLTFCLRLQCSSRVGTPASSSIPVVRARGFGHTNLLLTRVISIFWATLPFCFAFSHTKKIRRTKKNNIQNTHCLFAGRAPGWPPVSSKLALLTDGQKKSPKKR